jgi:hypothetical protein
VEGSHPNNQPLAADRAQLSDACMAAVTRLVEAQMRALMKDEGTEARDVANADTIAAFVGLGMVIGIPAMLEERVVREVGETVPETWPEKADWYQGATARVLYDLGGLLPRLLLVLTGDLIALRAGRLSMTLQPKPLRRGNAGNTPRQESIKQLIALRVLLEATLEGVPGQVWVAQRFEDLERNGPLDGGKPGRAGRKDGHRIEFSSRTYERWLAMTMAEDQVMVKEIARRLRSQIELSEAQRALYEKLTAYSIIEMLEALPHLV